jgi:exonuclease SbcC
MIPIRLTLKNFLPYQHPEPLEFEGIHLACLTGPNGAGKSSLLDAITWVLWGKARSNHDDDLINMGQNDMAVELDFLQEGVVYRVIRKRVRGKRGTGELNLYRRKDSGHYELDNKGGIRETEEHIRTLLKLDYATFVSSAFLQQGKADAFTTQTPAQRKKTLSDILGLDRWTTLETLAKAQLEGIERDLRFTESRILEIVQELDRRPMVLAQLEDAGERQAAALALLEHAQQREDELKHVSEQLRGTRAQRDERSTRLTSFDRDLKTAEANIIRYSDRVQRLEAIIAEREVITAGYESLQAAREIDTSLGDKLDLLRDLEQERSEINRQLSVQQQELKSESIELARRIADYTKQISEKPTDALEALQGELEVLDGLSAERAERAEGLRTQSEERSTLRERLKQLTDDGQKFNKRIEQLTGEEAPVCPLCGQPLTSEHRAELITQITAERDSLREIYLQTQQAIAALDQTLTANETALRSVERALRGQTELSERAGQLRQRISAADEAEDKRKADKARLEEITEMLNKETFGENLRRDLKKLSKREQKLGYDKSTHDDARQTLRTQSDYERRHAELMLAEQSLPEDREMLDSEQQRRERLLALMDDLRAELQAIDADIVLLTAQEGEYRERLAEKLRLAQQEKLAHEAVIRLKQELDSFDKQEERKAALELKLEQLRYDEAVYKELKTAFGKNGVPAMIIETAIPELEVEANEMLARMTDGRMHLRLMTQREKITGGLAETLDIEIADELGTRSYEMYSGGEAFRVNFALRVALSKMLARRAGAHLRTLFIDEGFGTQDESGRTKLVEAINAIQDDFDLILVITHIDELRDSFPVHINVEKTSEGSRFRIT